MRRINKKALSTMIVLGLLLGTYGKAGAQDPTYTSSNSGYNTSLTIKDGDINTSTYTWGASCYGDTNNGYYICDLCTLVTLKLV